MNYILVFHEYWRKLKERRAMVITLLKIIILSFNTT